MQIENGNYIINTYNSKIHFMSKFYIVLLFILGAVGITSAQTYPGYRTSNYSGVNGVVFNPANIADNRFKWDVNIFAINGFIGTNQSGLKFSDITRSFNADSLKSKLLRGSTNLNSLSYVDVLGPSVMFSLSPKTSLAFTTRSRVFANGSNINGNLAGAILDGGTTATGIPFNFNTKMLVHATGWTEIGGSIGQVFTPKASHSFFKGGITLKYIAGTADSYLSTNNLAGTVNGSGNTFLTATTGSIAFNTTAANFGDYKIADFFKFNGHGVGGDIGFVYEWRPTADYSMYVTDRFANKYKLKISASLLDVGRISFDRSNNQAASYAVNIPPAGSFALNQFAGKSVKDYKAIFDGSPYFTGTAVSSSYKVNLPTTVHAEIDLMVGGGFALNAAGQFTTNKTGTLSLYYYNAYSFTPRWENRMFSVELPLSYNELTQFNAGLAFRAGPFFVGSGTILSALVHDSRQADMHIGFHFGMQYKKKIKPDSDKDGVYDDKDKCPTVSGFARYDGCPIPDTDMDGINDEEDSCKTVAGVVRYHGCPIPDTDGDGVNDEEDACKTVAGLKKFDGCPDTDGDGIPDKNDKCPTVAGVEKYMGCPVPDTDGDGIPDDQDLCPNERGPASSRGCPVEKIVIQITADFKNILFDYGKSTIRPQSDTILAHAAKVMAEQIPNSNFYIDGYTDNKGKIAINKKLSKARAQAVANALIAHGVDKSRVIARGFGKDNPMCDNKTEAGRQCNRRVEVVIRNVNQREEQKSIKVKQ
jgi:outer membrane protein OmpA-like peptidoglycan-associated protein